MLGLSRLKISLMTSAGVGGSFSPASLFASGEPGGWYDPSDLTTLFQDSAGTTPVTAAGQSVGLWLDKSQGLALGSELVTNGDFSSGSNWTAGAGWSIGSGVAAASAVSGTNLDQSLVTTAGKIYVVTYTISSYTSGNVRVRFTGTSNVSGTIRSAAGTYTEYLYASVTNIVFRITDAGSAFTGSIDNVSVKELPGNHLTQSSASLRGIYGVEPVGGRRNLLTYTEQFDNAVWRKNNLTISANSSMAPDGTMTADTLTGSGSGVVFLRSSHNYPVGSAVRLSVYLKSGTASTATIGDVNIGSLGVFNLANGTVISGATSQISSVGDGWYRCSVLFVPIAPGGFYFNPGSSGAPITTDSILVWGAQFETGSTATAYQRVVTAFDVTQAGVPSLSYIQFDGSDDGYVSPTITPGIDKAQVFAGVRKLSDAATGSVAGTSTAPFANNGTFELFAPLYTNGYGYGTRGTTFVDQSVGGFPAPSTNVITAISEIATDTNRLRANGSQIGSSSLDQGTGNYLAYPLYVGRRGGATNPYNGRIYSLIVRFGANLTADQIAQTENWVAGKTGITI